MLSLGVAVGRDKVSFEKVAITWILPILRIMTVWCVWMRRSPRMDAKRIFSTLPLRASYERLRGVGLPVEISYTAGTYVCNHVFYEGTPYSGTPGGGGFLRGLCIFPPRKSIMSPLTHRQRLLHMPMLGE